MAPAKREPDEFASFAGDRTFEMSRSGLCIVGVHRPPLVYIGALYGVGKYGSSRSRPGELRSTEKTIIPPGWERTWWLTPFVNSDKVAVTAVPSDP